MAGKDVLLALLGGAKKCGIVAVRHKGKYYVSAPKELGGTKKMDADSLTDALHQRVDMMEAKLKGSKSAKRSGCGA